MVKSSTEEAVSLDELCSFFRVSPQMVIENGRYLLVKVPMSTYVCPRSEYMTLRGILHNFVSDSLRFYDVSDIQRLLRKRASKEVVQQFIRTKLDAILVEEPITGKKFYWVDDVELSFIDYQQGIADENLRRLSTMAKIYDIEPTSLFKIISHFGLRYDVYNTDVTPRSTLASLELFLSRFTLVSDKSIVDEARKIGISTEFVKGVGMFVENSIIDYLATNHDESDSTVTFEDGVDYVLASQLYNYLTGNKVVLNLGSLASDFFTSNALIINDIKVYRQDVIQLSIDYWHKGYPYSLAFALANQMVTEDELERVVTKHQLNKIMDKLIEHKILKQSARKRVLQSDLATRGFELRVQLYFKQDLRNIFVNKLKGLPLDLSYSDYVSVPLLIDFLNQSSNSYKLPSFIRNSGSEHILVGKDSRVISVSFSVLITKMENLSPDLYYDYNEWLSSKIGDSVALVDKTIEEEKFTNE